MLLYVRFSHGSISTVMGDIYSMYCVSLHSFPKVILVIVPSEPIFTTLPPPPMKLWPVSDRLSCPGTKKFMMALPSFMHPAGLWVLAAECGKLD